MRRVKISSKKSSVRVSLKAPTIDPNKKYRLTVERFDVPHLDSDNFREPLFHLRRKFVSGALYLAGEESPFQGCGTAMFEDDSFTRFQPENVVSAAGLVQQMNRFLQYRVKALAGLPAGGNPPDSPLYPLAIHEGPAVNNVPASFLARAGMGPFDEAWSNAVESRVRDALCVTFRTDGRLSFRFTTDAARMFVIELTAAGRELLGFDDIFITPVGTGAYSVALQQVSAYTAAPNNPYPFFHVFTGNRNVNDSLRYEEVVVRTSLPLNRQVHVHNNRTHYLRQLATFQLPSTPLEMVYQKNDRKVLHKFSDVHTFEEDGLTHNSFTLKGSSLQLFHIDLFLRKLIPGGTFSETPFPMDKHHYFTIQLLCAPF